MIDITTVLKDPELGSTAFEVVRTMYRREMGAVAKEEREVIEAVGCIHPGTAEQINQLPEEDRREEFIVVYTETGLSMGTNEGREYSGPDRIQWNGQLWRLVKLKPWTGFGFVQGYAVLVDEEGTGS